MPFEKISPGHGWMSHGPFLCCCLCSCFLKVLHFCLLYAAYVIYQHPNLIPAMPGGEYQMAQHLHEQALVEAGQAVLIVK